MDLFGKITVVTGVASEVGFMTACALYRAGAFVYIVDSDEARSRKAIERLQKCGHVLQTCEFVEIEMGNKNSIKKAAGKILDNNPSIDIFVNTIDWERSTDAKSVMDAFLPSMIKNHHGKIINVASNVNLPAIAQRTFDSWLKTGVIDPTKDLAGEMSQHGISVNCICVKSALGDDISQDEGSGVVCPASVATPHSHYPAEIEDAALLFACSASNHLTGQTLSLSC